MCWGRTLTCACCNKFNMEAYMSDIVRMKENGLTNKAVAEFLQNSQKAKGEDTFGLSERSVRRFCKHHEIGPQHFTDQDLRVAVDGAVEQVGPSYGRKMMTGFLASKGVKVAEARVGKVLRETHLPYHRSRLQGARNVNPIPYFAHCFGHKIHIDQNEKLCMFGVTHVMAIDGYSSKVVGWSSMPVKNNLLIYDNVYRPAVLENGLWDQVRVDHGTEFYLTLYMQEKNSHLRANCSRQPYIQTKSTRNHKIERMWPEVNQRVNYPIKGALVELTDAEKLDMDDSLVKFCVSTLCLQICELAVGRVVDSWNAHRIPGKGIPNKLSHDSVRAPVTAQDFPPAQVAADWYSRDLGSTLTPRAKFGEDPFSTEEERNACMLEVQRELPALDQLLNCAVNQDFAPLQNAVLQLVDITRRHVT